MTDSCGYQFGCYSERHVGSVHDESLRSQQARKDLAVIADPGCGSGLVLELARGSMR